MSRHKYCSSEYDYSCPDSDTFDLDDEECPNHSDLYLLRDAAADERGAIADYLACAMETCLEKLFLHVAEDEMQHYMETMRLISSLDPVQAQMLEEEDLDFLVMQRAPIGKPKWGPPGINEEEEDVDVPPPGKKDMPAIRCLTKALQDELHAINKYQEYMNKAVDSGVRDHFCELMNDEKEHVAEFTAALFKITHEPMAQED
ncbi:hypothetical protein P22_1404 [Propionispora sp. 2/2-37]|uniref:ferritin-like domain-containing protein n=1 Tax=Propionispora sp. 2/2-37 TaxID=1677858 RepID=UPI0006BB551B|nr:ferritin-like domain-containing protein [Propionispora sp. 2/2-37]CUH95334.1 hypothetical protein P22_1404 [Propionispora sp. 2/2-37]